MLLFVQVKTHLAGGVADVKQRECGRPWCKPRITTTAIPNVRKEVYVSTRHVLTRRAAQHGGVADQRVGVAADEHQAADLVASQQRLQHALVQPRARGVAHSNHVLHVRALRSGRGEGGSKVGVGRRNGLLHEITVRPGDVASAHPVPLPVPSLTRNRIHSMPTCPAPAHAAADCPAAHLPTSPLITTSLCYTVLLSTCVCLRRMPCSAS